GRSAQRSCAGRGVTFTNCCKTYPPPCPSPTRGEGTSSSRSKRESNSALLDGPHVFSPSFHRCRVEHGGRGGARGRPGARASGEAAVPALGGILSRPRSRPRRVGCDLHPRDGESQTRHGGVRA